MHRTVRPVLLVTALGTMLLTVGCSTAPSVAPPPTGPSAESVAWVDGVCTTVKPFADAIAAGPQAGGDDAASAITALSTFLAGGTTALDGTIAGLENTAPAPVDGGAEILAAITTDFTQQRAALQDAKAKVDAIDPANTETLATAVPAALEGLPGNLDPTAQLRTDPELAVAADRSESCRALETVAQ